MFIRRSIVSKAVPWKALKASFSTTGSPGAGRSASVIAASQAPGSMVASVRRPLWKPTVGMRSEKLTLTTWITGTDAARAAASTAAQAGTTRAQHSLSVARLEK